MGVHKLSKDTDLRAFPQPEQLVKVIHNDLCAIWHDSFVGAHIPQEYSHGTFEISHVSYIPLECTEAVAVYWKSNATDEGCPLKLELYYAFNFREQRWVYSPLVPSGRDKIGELIRSYASYLFKYSYDMQLRVEELNRGQE